VNMDNEEKKQAEKLRKEIENNKKALVK